MLLVLPSCVARHVRNSEGVPFSWELMQARHVDVPLPLHAVPNLAKSVCSDREDDHIIFAFSVRQSAQDLIDYYLTHMEQLGWQLISVSHIQGHRMVITFKKPYKSCTIVGDFNQTSGEVSVHVVPRQSTTH